MKIESEGREIAPLFYTLYICSLDPTKRFRRKKSRQKKSKNLDDMYSGGSSAREREEIMERRAWERKMIKAGVFTREEIINARIQDAPVFGCYNPLEYHDSAQLWEKDIRCFTPYLYRGNEYSLKKELKELHPMWRYHIIATGKNKMALKVQFFPL